MWNEEPVAALLEKAAAGADVAWREIIARYSPLVSAICRRYGLTRADTDDVAGNVWMALVTSVTAVRTAAALPGWLATTTRRQCLIVLRDKRRHVPSAEESPDRVESEVDDLLVAEERRAAVHSAVRQLPQRDQRLLALLFTDPPTPYADISSTLGMPIGAIGPSRQRCLARMRRDPVIAALLLDDRHAQQSAIA